MRLVHVIIGLGVGGAENMLCRLVLAQRQADPALRCTVVSLTTLGAIGATLRAAGVEVVALGLDSPLGLPLVLGRLHRLMRRLRPDVVQTWMVHADLIGGLAARWAGVPAVIWGIRTTDFAHTGASTRAVRWVCARLSKWLPRAIVCAAEASRKSHVAIGYAAARMVVIPNGFELERLCPDPQRRQRIRAELGFDDRHWVLGCVGRYNPAKDQANFVRAAGLVAARLPQARFLLVGRDVDAHNAPLAALMAETGHADRFVLLGERQDVPACLDAMDAFALPSRSEGFPNVVGEAMAMALPCAVTDVGDAAWLVGDTGRVVPPEDSVALSQAVLDLAALTPTDRKALGERARARIVDEFSMQRACDRFARLQHEVLNMKSKAGT